MTLAESENLPINELQSSRPTAICSSPNSFMLNSMEIKLILYMITSNLHPQKDMLLRHMCLPW